MLMGPGLDNTGKPFYTINNKRKEAQEPRLYKTGNLTCFIINNKILN
jgi:hypothetical protein